MSDSVTSWTVDYRLLHPWDFPGKRTGILLPLPSVNFLVTVLFCTIIMEDVTFGENWVMYIHDPSVLSLTVACESTTISKYNFFKNKEKIL